MKPILDRAVVYVGQVTCTSLCLDIPDTAVNVGMYYTGDAERAYLLQTPLPTSHQYRIHHVSNLHLDWYNIDADELYKVNDKIHKYYCELKYFKKIYDDECHLIF